MKIILVKVLSILILILVGAKGAIDLTSDDVSTISASARLTHDTTDFIKENSELKSAIAAFKETIQSQENFSGSVRNIPKTYTSCVEALQNDADSGIYTLQLPFSGLQPFDVYCLRDPDNGPAWTVVQRRRDGSVNFQRNWAEYQLGFGNLKGEFFLGLKHLYALTNQRKPQELWIQLADWEGATRTAMYSEFKIGPESSKYNMTQLGVYSGDAGDSLSDHYGMQFTTIDSDNALYPKNCAEERGGAWWFYNCGNAHLNGKYLQGELPQTSDYHRRGVFWYHWRGNLYSNKYSHMALRPSN